MIKSPCQSRKVIKLKNCRGKLIRKETQEFKYQHTLDTKYTSQKRVSNEDLASIIGEIISSPQPAHESFDNHYKAPTH